MLSNRDIWDRLERGEIVIRPRPPRAAYGGASVDLLLHDEIRMFDVLRCPYIDYERVEQDREYLESITFARRLAPGEPLILHPGKVVICSTVEWVEIPADLCAELHGRSSLARIGVLPHTAGKIDPGWKGRLTLEVSNVGEIPVAFYAGKAICQMVFHELSSPADLSYREAISRYHMQDQASVARPRDNGLTPG